MTTTSAQSKPPAWLVMTCAAGSAAAMAVAVYFGGHGQLPVAMTGTGLFVVLGGISFELARRRSA